MVSGIRGLFGRKKQQALPAADKNASKKKTLPPASSEELVPVED